MREVMHLGTNCEFCGQALWPADAKLNGLVTLEEGRKKLMFAGWQRVVPCTNPNCTGPRVRRVLTPDKLTLILLREEDE